MRIALALSALLVLVPLVLAGCSAKAEPNLDVQVQWRDASHAMMTVRNDGKSAADMNAVMASMHMAGPNGTIPMYWGGLNGTSTYCWMGDDVQGMHGHMGSGHCGMMGSMPMYMGGSQLQPGQTWTYQMHALMANGGWGMMMMPAPANGGWMMHGSGSHMTMMSGMYEWHMDGGQASARWS